MTDTTSGWERRRLVTTAFALAVVFGLLVGFVLTLFDDRLTLDSILSSIGVNLIASVMFALFFSWLSGNIQQRALLANLREAYGAATERQEAATVRLSQKIDALTGELFGKLAGFQRLYMPDATYEASVVPAPEFNRDINASLAEAFNYAFRGTSAKFVSLRLERIRPRNLNAVEIVTLDPQSTEALKARAVERLQQRRADNMPAASVEEVIEDIRQEILMSLVALFDQRQRCSVKVAFAQEPSATRLEVFDDAVYVSWYQSPKSTRLPFPETFRFLRGSFLYEVYALEVRRRHDLADRTLEFRRRTTEAELPALLTPFAGRPVSVGDLSAWRGKYAQFVRSVEGDVGGTGHV
jgi:hypothetical protein